MERKASQPVEGTSAGAESSAGDEWGRERATVVGALAGWLCFVGALGFLFRWNAVDVMSAAGRFSHGAISAVLLLGVGFWLYLMWRLNQTATQVARGRAVLRLLAICGATLHLLFLAEGLARTFPVYDSLGINPGTQFMWPEFSLPKNSLGYKDREPKPKKGPRILVLGDSFTEGAGVRRPDRFSSVLERLYRDETDPQLEVFNAGHCGMDTHDEARILAATGDAIAPDVVVVAYTLNDADGRGIRRPERPPSLARFFLKDLRSYAFYRLYSRGWRAAPTVEEDPFVAQHKDESPGWELVVESLDEIVEWAEARSIPVLLIALPVFAEYGERHRHVLEKVVMAARARGFRTRNTIDDFKGRLSELAVGAADAHPGKEAHHRIALELRRFVGRPWAEKTAEEAGSR